MTTHPEHDVCRQDTRPLARAHARENAPRVDSCAAATLIRAEVMAAARRPRGFDEAPLRTPRIVEATRALLVAARASDVLAAESPDPGAQRLAVEVARVTRAALARLVEGEDGTVTPDVERDLAATGESLDGVVRSVYRGSDA